MFSTKIHTQIAMAGLMMSCGVGGIALGANVSWTGNTNNDWHTGSNWSLQCPGGVPFCFFAVPDADDDVTVSSNITGNDVDLSANAEIQSLLVSNGMRVDANGFRLNAGGGSGLPGPLLRIDGAGSLVTYCLVADSRFTRIRSTPATINLTGRSTCKGRSS